MKINRQKEIWADARWTVNEGKHYTAIWIGMPYYTDAIEVRFVDTIDGKRVAWDCTALNESTLIQGMWVSSPEMSIVPVALSIPGNRLIDMTVKELIASVKELFAYLGRMKIYQLAVAHGLWDRLGELE